jgi:putative salt-induced outer membrane protein YdiY
LIICAFALFTTLIQPVAAQQVLTLQNGDRLSGTLKEISGGDWIFTLGGADARIAATTIVGFSTTTPIGVRLVDGTIDATTISAVPGGLQLTVGGTTRTVTPDQIAAVGAAADLAALVPILIGFLSPFGKFWALDLGFGFSDKSGNSRSQGFTGSVDIERRTSRDRETINFGVIRESTEGTSGDLEATVSKYYGSLRLDVFAGPRVFVFGATRQERDTFQDIALRSTYEGGLGFQAVSKDNTDLSFSVALGARREDFISAGAETASVGTLGALLRNDFGPAAMLFRADYSPKLSTLEDYRFVSEASITAPLIAGVGFRIGGLFEHSSRPQPGIEKNDLLITTQLSYSLGR